MSSKIAKLFTTFFYVGYFPFAAGSLASLVGVIFYILFFQWPAWFIFLAVIVNGLGFFYGTAAEKSLGRKDPPCIVIDEVGGMMIGLVMLPLEAPVIICAYFLFRAFDMFKIYPANKFEKLNGSAGIMLDDVIAGVYTNLIMHAAIVLAGH